MLKFAKSPLIRSLAALALIGGVALWNYASSAHGTCYSKCWHSNHVDVWYRSPCLDGVRLCGEYSLVSYPAGSAPDCTLHPLCITWLGLCPVDHVAAVGRERTIHCLTCIAFYPPVGRCCPCAGCGVAHCCTFCHLSNAASYCLPTGIPDAWIQTCVGRCVYDL
jgi:hypothetical protein